jgi:hypothetical protein
MSGAVAPQKMQRAPPFVMSDAPTIDSMRIALTDLMLWHRSLRTGCKDNTEAETNFLDASAELVDAIMALGHPIVGTTATKPVPGKEECAHMAVIMTYVVDMTLDRLVVLSAKILSESVMPPPYMHALNNAIELMGDIISVAQAFGITDPDTTPERIAPMDGDEDPMDDDEASAESTQDTEAVDSGDDDMES